MSDGMLRKENWVWMPHAAHLIVGHDCRFHLATCVGRYLVSTVGEYLPDADCREMLAQHRGIMLVGKGDARRVDWLKKVGYEDIGYNRKYETMVFPAKSRSDDSHHCCPFEAVHDGGELAMRGYNDPEAAYRGHLELCEEWAIASKRH